MHVANVRAIKEIRNISIGGPRYRKQGQGNTSAYLGPPNHNSKNVRVR
jgi:hypothetical protein